MRLLESTCARGNGRTAAFGGSAALARADEVQRLDIPFLMVSGVVGEETAVVTMKAGAHDFSSKATGQAGCSDRARTSRRRGQTQAARGCDALREMEVRFNAFMNNIPTPAWIKDEKSACANQCAACGSGGAVDDLIGCTDFEVMPRESRAACATMIPRFWCRIRCCTRWKPC
jgi:hypothetical protein